jgi:hypothetical protein
VTSEIIGDVSLIEESSGRQIRARQSKRGMQRGEGRSNECGAKSKDAKNHSVPHYSISPDRTEFTTAPATKFLHPGLSAFNVRSRGTALD